MFDSFIGKFKVLFKSPFTVFVYGILSKWFVTIFITGIVVAYWVFKGLSDSGILKKAEDIVFDALIQTKSVAQYCIPKITPTVVKDSILATGLMKVYHHGFDS